MPKRKYFPVGGCAHAAKDERREGIYRHQAEVSVEHVDVPYGFERGVRAVHIGIAKPERMEIAETIGRSLSGGVTGTDYIKSRR